MRRRSSLPRLVGTGPSHFFPFLFFFLSVPRNQTKDKGFVRREKKENLKDVPSEMITHEIGIFGEINSLESKSSETLPPIDGLILGGGGATAPWLRTPVSVHLSLSGASQITIPNSNVLCRWTLNRPATVLVYWWAQPIKAQKRGRGILIFFHIHNLRHT